MASLPMASSLRVLEPIDRISEVLFGLIMALTFTGSLSVAEAGREDVKTMLVGALGCNLAWGVIDAIFYLMGCIAEHGRNLATFRAVQHARDERAARTIVADALPPIVASVLEPAELDNIRIRLQQVPEPPGAGGLARGDYLAALGVFLLVFLSTLPVALPFMLLSDVRPAMRLSNAIAVVLLFLTGYAFGRVSGRHPWLLGAGMVVLGLVLVGLTIALGG
jgi:VIT1/CCC1 family predicted Fe2+/Mn2+ transporter